ncbi:MAG TPA: hypothetical protein VM818_14865 [Vicinamibacterales bacterium]|nr:hypothetical protein [Vicinamibacterales bacterium]
MNRRAARVCCVVFALLAVSSLAEAQSYPKLVTNGNGLALTRLAVDQRSGTSWVDAATYMPGPEYRLTVRLTNFYPPPNYGGMATRCHVNYLTDLRFEIGIPATFYTNSSYSTVFTTGRYALEPVDRQPLPSTESRTYYVYFKWNGPAIATAIATINVSVGGSEVCALPNMPMVPVRATS